MVYLKQREEYTPTDASLKESTTLASTFSSINTLVDLSLTTDNKFKNNITLSINLNNIFDPKQTKKNSLHLLLLNFYYYFSIMDALVYNHMNATILKDVRTIRDITLEIATKLVYVFCRQFTILNFKLTHNEFSSWAQKLTDQGFQHINLFEYASEVQRVRVTPRACAKLYPTTARAFRHWMIGQNYGQNMSLRMPFTLFREKSELYSCLPFYTPPPNCLFKL